MVDLRVSKAIFTSPLLSLGMGGSPFRTLNRQRMKAVTAVLI